MFILYGASGQLARPISHHESRLFGRFLDIPRATNNGVYIIYVGM